MFLLLLSVCAALLQGLGYIVYIRMSLKHAVNPNGATWFMFAYGVTVLTFLEWDSGAGLGLLLLPIVCATLAIFTAYLCWKRGSIKWPNDWEDRVAFLADVVLTLLYISTAYLASADTLTEIQKQNMLNVFLIASNATAVTSFAPLIRGVRRDPAVEKALPWAIWTGAYVILGAATYMTDGLSNLLIYPIVNMVLHGAVAVLASRR